MNCKVSVVIPVYNAEDSIERAILSINKQNLDGIEVIIVDDGSTDSTPNIIKNLKIRNGKICIINQKNSGASAARNKGLLSARGEYITFLDADDIYPENIFKDIYQYVKSEDADLFVGNIECFNDVRKWRLSYMQSLFNGRKTFSTTLEQSPEIQLSPSVCNKWFKRDLLKGITFNEKVSVGEDLLFTESCYLQSQKVAIADWIVYKYRVVNIETLSKNKSLKFFEDLLEVQSELISTFKEQGKEHLLQLIIQRQTKFFIDSIFLRIDSLNNDLENFLHIGNTFFNVSKMYLENITFDHNERNFLSKLFLEEDKSNIRLFLKMLDDNNYRKDYIYESPKVYSYLSGYFEKYKDFLMVEPKAVVKVEDLSLNGWNLNIKGFAFIRGFDSALQSKKLVFTNKQSGKVVYLPLENSLRTDLSYIFREDKVSYDHGGFLDVSINLNEILGKCGEWKVEVLIEIKGIFSINTPLVVPLAEIKNKAKVKFIKSDKGIKEIFCFFEEGKYLTVRIAKLSHISYVKSKIRLLKRNVRYDIGLLKRKKYKSFIALMAYKLFGKYIRSKNIWLMGERADTAQDNTYHLYKYIRRERPDINAYYVIKKNSKDRKGIEAYKNIVNYGSLKHTLYLLCSSFMINSYVERPNMYTLEYIDIIKYYPEYRRNKKVFLQHGVIGVSRVNHVLHKNKVDYDLFITSSPFEKDHIVKEFGYLEEEVVVTGLPRWDQLNNSSVKKKVLLMPTWRSWIQSEEELLQSEYFNRYIELMRDKRIVEYLIKYDYELVFYPHYQTQKIIQKYNIEFHERIRIVRQGEKKVQDLLNECQILITDYSTVSFDFGYMHKPVIFYQFDYSEFYSRHYNEGPIQHKKQLFGPVVEEIDEVIAEIEAYLKGRENPSHYAKRIGLFIEAQQKSHNERVFDEIEKINKRKCKNRQGKYGKIFGK